MNNFGGRIFKNIFKKDIFMNPHQVQFKHWAKMWSWDYVQWEEIPTNFSELPKQVVIELLPNAEHTAFFNEKWEALWKNI
jgi:2-succinyl-5-enolpyruvyl-6-hydroxy-3-cyclohexene-1-carboxylate synthase